MNRISSLNLSPEPLQLRIAMIGSHGALGIDLCTRLKVVVPDIIELQRSMVDIGKEDEVIDRIGLIQPDLVINCAAYTAVDRAESEPHAAYAANRDGPAYLAKICSALQIPLIHISTDYVFDGSSDHPYREDDPANPLCVYGRSKWEGEEAIRAGLSEHIIIRTSWMFGAHGNNFVKTIATLANERREIRVVDDQLGCPTFTGDLADAIVSIICQVSKNRRKTHWGTYHYCGAGVTTWYGFSRTILKNLQHRGLAMSTRIFPIPSNEYSTPAIRPRYSALDCTRISQCFGIQPVSWLPGMQRVVESIMDDWLREKNL